MNEQEFSASEYKILLQCSLTTWRDCNSIIKQNISRRCPETRIQDPALAACNPGGSSTARTLTTNQDPSTHRPCSSHCWLGAVVLVLLACWTYFHTTSFFMAWNNVNWEHLYLGVSMWAYVFQFLFIGRWFLSEADLPWGFLQPSVSYPDF